MTPKTNCILPKVLVPTMLSMMMAGPLQGQALLDDLSHKAVKFFWEQSNPKTGLTKDRAANFQPTDEYIVASVAASGYALCAYAIGAHRHWLDRKQALERSRSSIDWLNKHGLKEHGWFFHFVDWRNGERHWKSEASSIDTGLLLAGEIMAEREFNDPKLTALVNETFSNIDWKWMVTDGGAKPDSATLCMGWHPEDGFIKARWDGQYESTFLNLIALGSSKAVPDSLWPAIRRTPVVDFSGGQYIIGGCIFMHQMTQVFVNLKDQRDSLGYDYWIEGRNACRAQRAYAISDPKGFKGYGPDFWGLNAGDAPSGYVGNGVPEGTGSDDGTISPTGAIASIIYDRDNAIAVANHLAKDYPESLGIYGFSNGVNPTKNWHGPDVIGIDLGMELLAIESDRDGLPQKLSGSSPIYKLGLRRAGFRKTDEGPTEKRPLKLN
jgi:hypothetical protein